MIVIDASVAIAMCLDEREHLGNETNFEALGEQDLIVPAHWHTEIGNALVVNMRRGRLGSEQLVYALANLQTLNVTTHAIPEVHDIRATVEGAVRSGLTYYDELYVRLAELKSIPLFTLDKQMRMVAERRGVSVLPA